MASTVQSASVFSPDALKIFISYSRADIVAADAMVADLERNGFTVTIDRRDLPYGEEWQKELASFIAASDTVVWLVSPASVKSRWVNWELGEVGRLSKRLVPVKVAETDPATLPEALGRIHLLPSVGVYASETHERDLVETLNTDRSWLKKATSLSDDAREWLAANRDGAHLLRGRALVEAEAWSALPPRDVPAPASEILELILASRRGQDRRRRMTVTGSIVAAIVAIGLAATAVWFGVRAEEQAAEAERQRVLAEQNEQRAIQQEAATREQRNIARYNETVGLAALSREGIADGSPVAATKLALAAWPRIGDSDRPSLRRSLAALNVALPKLHERGQIDAPAAAAFSSDGRWVLAGSRDGTIRLHDASSGDVVQTTHLASATRITRLAFSGDGSRFIAIGFEPSVAVIFSTSDMQVISSLEPGTWVIAAGLSYDGRVAFLAESDGKIHIAADSQKIWTLKIDATVSTASLSADGTRLLVIGETGGGSLVDVVTGKPIQPLGEKQFNARFSPDGRYYATVGLNMPAEIRRASDGGIVFTSATNAEYAEFARNDGNTVLLAGPYGAALYEVPSGKLLVDGEGHPPNATIIAAQVYADDASIATLTRDRQIVVSRLADRFDVTRLEGQSADFVSAKFFDDGETLYTYSNQDGLVRRWSIARPMPLHESHVRGFLKAMSADSTKFITLDIERGEGLPTKNVVRVYERHGRDITVVPEGGDQLLESVALASDGSRLITAGITGAINVFSATTGDHIAQWNDDSFGVQAALSADGSIAAIHTHDRLILRNAGTGELLSEAIVACCKGAYSLHFSPSGEHLLSTHGTEGIALWEINGVGEPPHLVRMFDVSATFAKFAANTGQILGFNYGGAHLIDGTTGTIYSLPGADGVRHASISADGTRVVVSTKEMIKIVDGATGVEISRINRADSEFIEFAAQDAQLVEADRELLRVWDLSAVEKGNAFEIACQRLKKNTSIKDVQVRYDLGKLTPICGENAPAQVDWSKLR